MIQLLQVTPVDLYYTDTLRPDDSVQKGFEVDSTFKDINGNDSIGKVIKYYDWYYAIHPNSSDTIWMERKYVIFNASLDTVYFIDFAQNLCAVNMASGGIWISRDMMRFGEKNPQWYRIRNKGNENVTCLEFAKDGNYLWYGTRTGGLYRISNLDNLYGRWPDGKLDSSAYVSANLRKFGLTVTDLSSKITGSNAIGGIDVDPNNPDHVIVTTGGFGGGAKVWESNTATGTGSFKSIQGDLPDMPVFDGIIDYRDENKIVVGTFYGVYATEDGGANWYQMNNEIGHVPVFEVVQQWREWSDDGGVINSGSIYLGTHGRGIWSTSQYVGIEDETTNSENSQHLVLFPNPSVNDVWLSLSSVKDQEIDVKVFDLNGSLVYSRSNVAVTPGGGQLRLEVKDLPVGTYVVRVNGQTVTRTGRFVKMR